MDSVGDMRRKLVDAVVEEDIEKANYLLEKGASVNTLDEHVNALITKSTII
jgi:hypothetical protein